MGAYRRDDFNNPAHFASTCVALLEQFPDTVIENATSPKSGLQTQAAFPPNPAEIRAFCERSLRSYQTIALNNARKQRAAELAKNPSPPPPSGPKVDLATHSETAGYWLDPARKEDHPVDPRNIKRKPWVPRSLKELAAEAGKVMTDEEIETDYAANSKLCPPPKDTWKKLKAS
jgi:hypothetical protein